MMVGGGGGEGGIGVLFDCSGGGGQRGWVGGGMACLVK